MRTWGARAALIVGMAVGGLGLPVAAAPAGAQDDPPAPALVTPLGGPRAGGATRVEVDLDLLRQGQGRRVGLDAPDGRDLELVLSPAAGPAGWSAWTGEVAGDPHSSVDVVRRGEVVAASVVTEDGAYRIQHTAAGPVLRPARVVDGEGPDAVIPPPGLAESLEPGPVPLGASEPAPRATDAPVVDLLVAYTPAAESQMGGTSAIQAEIALGVSSTNTAFSDSGVAGSVRLVGTQRTSANVLADSAGLAHVTDPQNGVLDEVPTRRTALGADLVQVFTGETTTGCGIGWLLQSMGQGGALGYSLVDWGCAVDNSSMPHEIGHNMGLEHDRYVSPNNALAGHGHGYVNVGQRWRTIMAYNDQCADAGAYCTRLRRFSNPDQLWGGFPLGRPASGSASADSRAVLTTTFPVVARWRSSYAPFTSWSRFVTQQSKDFEGRSPTGSELMTQVNALANGERTPTEHITSKMRGSTFGVYAPVARLYFAYFLRTPDKAGLDYWVGRYRSGTSLPRISRFFAGSREFTNRYGPLTNRAFVEQVYQNVLGRPGDSTGMDFWTGQLDSGARTRGSVMVGFSEASEFKRVRSHEIDTVLVYRGLLQRTPTSSEFATQVGRLEGGTSLSLVIAEILATTEYANRVTR